MENQGVQIIFGYTVCVRFRKIAVLNIKSSLKFKFILVDELS